MFFLTSMVFETLEMVVMMLIDLYCTASIMMGSLERVFCHCYSHDSSDILP